MISITCILARELYGYLVNIFSEKNVVFNAMLVKRKEYK